MIPESELVKSEIVLRDLVLSPDVKLSKKKQIRWLALSLGLISPGESRTLMLDVFEAILNKIDMPFNSDQIVEEVCSMKKVKDDGEKKKVDKAVRYHLTRLIKMGLIERKKRNYSWVKEDLTDKPIESLKRKILNKLNRIFSNMEKVYSSYSAGKPK
ncbi:hypothetical protein J7J90_00340 [Candidatus Micrarchaeota archaeon]|nr:hypothetical protein [Candidatus Micrarchaeota archaeon]